MKRILLIILICLLLPIQALATPSYGKTGAEGYFDGDVGIAGALFESVTTSSSTNTLTIAESGLVLVSDAHTETLPTALGNAGLTYHFIKTDWDYDLITLEGDGAETFNYENSTGSPNLTYLRLNTPCAEVTIVSDGTNWQVINERLGQVPYANVYLSADQLNIANTTWTKLLFDTETADIGSNFNVGTSLFTCPVSGYYTILGHVIWLDGTVIASKFWMSNVTINGTDYPPGLIFHSSSTSGIKLVMQNYLDLDKDDTIELQVYHNGGAATPDIDGGTTDLTSMIIILKAKE